MHHRGTHGLALSAHVNHFTNSYSRTGVGWHWAMSDVETPAHGKNITTSVQKPHDKGYTSKTNKSYKYVLLLIKYHQISNLTN
jgi:hypothetical protein